MCNLLSINPRHADGTPPNQPTFDTSNNYPPVRQQHILLSSIPIRTLEIIVDNVASPIYELPFIKTPPEPPLAVR